MGVLKYRDPETGEWRVAGSYTGPVVATSFNGRTGDVVPQAADYSAFYVGRGETVDAYSKEETLSDDTKALLGLEADATPDAAFELLHGAQSGGVKIAVGTYKGTGTCGNKYPMTLTFDFKPKFLMVWGYAHHIMRGVEGQLFVVDTGYDDEITIAQTSTTWGSNYVRWYYDHPNGDYFGHSQMNVSEATYSYIAIGE